MHSTRGRLIAADEVPSLADVRRASTEKQMSLKDTADAIVEVVDQAGLRPESAVLEPGRPIDEADLGVVCFQVVV